MKACLVLLIIFVTAFVASAENEEFEDFVHEIQKRQIMNPVQGRANTPFPRCVYSQCVANCGQRGHRGGGYCTINGCQCFQ